MVTNIYLTPIMLQVSILCEVIPTVPAVTKQSSQPFSELWVIILFYREGN